MNSRTGIVLALAGTLAAPAVLAQTCSPAIRPSAPDARYVVNATQHTVLDKQTGLTWKRCVEGQFGALCGNGSPAAFNWYSALRRAEASTFAGYKDWRIPNSKELGTLLEVACYDPALNATVFPNDPSDDVWASSRDSYWPAAWVVNFYSGVHPKGYDLGNSFAVRLVRGGQ